MYVISLRMLMMESVSLGKVSNSSFHSPLLIGVVQLHFRKSTRHSYGVPILRWRLVRSSAAHSPNSETFRRAFDVVTMAITFAYLFKFSTANGASMNKLARIMFEDGITYFLALTGTSFLLESFLN